MSSSPRKFYISHGLENILSKCNNLLHEENKPLLEKQLKKQSQILQKNTTTKFMSSSVNVKIVADFITRNVYKSTKPTSWSVITFQPAIPHQRMRQQEGKRSERETIVPLSFPDMNVQLTCVLLVGNEKRFGLCIWGVPRNDCILVSIVPLVTILIVLRHFAR